MKVLLIRFEMTQAEYEDIRQFYSDKEIREILKEGGLGEISQLMNTKDRLHSAAYAWEDDPSYRRED